MAYVNGRRAFYWTPKGVRHPLCLQSKEYNRDMKGVTWVYYSEKDSRKLLNFLRKVFEK